MILIRMHSHARKLCFLFSLLVLGGFSEVAVILIRSHLHALRRTSALGGCDDFHSEVSGCGVGYVSKVIAHVAKKLSRSASRSSLSLLGYSFGSALNWVPCGVVLFMMVSPKVVATLYR